MVIFIRWTVKILQLYHALQIKSYIKWDCIIYWYQSCLIWRETHDIRSHDFLPLWHIESFILCFALLHICVIVAVGPREIQGEIFCCALLSVKLVSLSEWDPEKFKGSHMLDNAMCVSLEGLGPPQFVEDRDWKIFMWPAFVQNYKSIRSYPNRLICWPWV